MCTAHSDSMVFKERKLYAWFAQSDVMIIYVQQVGTATDTQLTSAKGFTAKRLMPKRKVCH